MDENEDMNVDTTHILQKHLSLQKSIKLEQSSQDTSSNKDVNLKLFSQLLHAYLLEKTLSCRQ